MSYPMIEIGDLMLKRNGSVDPSKFPDETFELHSIPAFDKGTPDILKGSEIGSSKQLVQENDVMISKIVPHIRRASVVCPKGNFRQIASGEWITFRSDKIYPDYLKHVLISDTFNKQFMATVSGVGGSLLRARPAFVAKIKIVLPPLAEQRRIAAILDQADKLRQKRQQAIKKLDQLLPATFIDMFGDPEKNPKKWNKVILGDICDPKDRVNYGVVQPGNDFEGGIPLIRVGDIDGGILSFTSIKTIDPEIEKNYSRSRLKGNEILVSCVGSIGTIAKVPNEAIGFNIARAITRVPLQDKRIINFVAECLKTEAIQNYFKKNTRTVSQPTLNVSFVKETKIILPSEEKILDFCKVVDKIELEKKLLQKALIFQENLFKSLQDQAFSGTL